MALLLALECMRGTPSVLSLYMENLSLIERAPFKPTQQSLQADTRSDLGGILRVVYIIRSIMSVYRFR